MQKIHILGDEPLDTWKISKYIYIYKEEEQGVIFSTVSGSIMLLHNNELQYIENVKERVFQMQEIPQELFDILNENQFIVPSDCNETQQILSRHKSNLATQEIFHLTVFITDLCNFNCPYCFVQKIHQNTMTSAVFDRVYRFVEANIEKYKGLDISWFGGEPLEKADLIVEYTKTFRQLCLDQVEEKSFRARIVTNGYDLTLPTFKKLYEAGINSFQVTFDGDEASHNNVRIHQENGATFQRIFRNLMSIRLTNYQNISINVRCNLGTDDTDKFLIRYTKYFAKDPRFQIALKPIVNYGSDNESELLGIYAGKIKELCDYAIRHKILDGFVKSKFMIRNLWCTTLSEYSVVISPDAKIYTCDSTMNNPNYCVGELGEDGEIIPNGAFDSTYYEHTVDGKCLDCKRMPMCYGSCQRIYHKIKKHACALNDTDINNFLHYIINQ